MKAEMFGWLGPGRRSVSRWTYVEDRRDGRSSRSDYAFLAAKSQYGVLNTHRSERDRAFFRVPSFVGQGRAENFSWTTAAFRACCSVSGK